VFDGINFGASDYTYSAYSMVNSFSHLLIKKKNSSCFSSETLPNNEPNENLQVAVASVSIPCLVYLSAHNGFIGIWVALTIYMSLRTIASTWRYDTIPLSSILTLSVAASFGHSNAGLHSSMLCCCFYLQDGGSEGTMEVSPEVTIDQLRR